MQLLLKKTEHGLVPIYDDCVEALKKVAMGGEIVVEYKPRRNSMFHRKLFALLNAVLPNQSAHKTIDNILNEVKLKSGHYETMKTQDGFIFHVPKSISFSNMDEAEFEKFYSNALDVCLMLVGDDAMDDILKFL